MSLQDSMKERGVDVKKILATSPPTDVPPTSPPPVARPPSAGVKHLEIFTIDSRHFQLCRLTLFDSKLANFAVSKNDLSCEISLTSQGDILELQRIVNECINLLTP
jgi:hypothetical protein